MNVLRVPEKFDGSIVKHVQLAKFSLTEVIYPPGYRTERCHPIGFICFAVAGEFTESYGSYSQICDSSTIVYHRANTSIRSCFTAGEASFCSLNWNRNGWTACRKI